MAKSSKSTKPADAATPAAPAWSCSSKLLKDPDKFLATMKRKFQQAEDAIEEIHEEALKDWQFREGGTRQWDEKVLKKRNDEGRPVYTINRMPQFLRQVTGPQKKNRPSIQIDPIGDGADKETAEIQQGLVRHIERTGDAEEALDCAFDSMATGGFGFVRLTTVFADEDANLQDIVYLREPNPFAHFPDPRCKKLDYSDARIWFVVDDMLEDDYRDEYPDSDLAGYSSIGGMAHVAPNWIKAGNVRVAECFWIEGEGKNAKVFWCKTNGVEILDARDIPGRYIPIVPLIGEEIIVEGRRHLIGLLRYAREPQMLYNLWQSAMAEAVAMAPKAPYKVTPKQVEGFEDVWEDANNSNFPYLPYNPDPQAPPPARDIAEPAIVAIQQAILHADNDLKNTTGLDDPSLGKRGPQEAAQAILLRQQKGDVATFGFQDSINRAIKHLGRIILGWIPAYYDTARVVRILQPDGESKTIQINQHFRDDKGLLKIYDLTVGKYDVSVSTGPSHESARQAAAESMLQLVQAQPALMNVIGDLLVGSMDWPQAQECAERLKKMLPAPLQDPIGPDSVPPQVQARMAQMGSLVERMTATIHALSAKLEGKQVESATRERVALIQAAAGIQEAALKARSTEAMFEFEQNLDHIDRMLSLIPDPAMGQEAAAPPAAPPSFNGGAPPAPAAGGPGPGPGAAPDATAPADEPNILPSLPRAA